MLTIIIYDIEETKNRNDLIKKLRHYGLIRIQKSVFAGHLNKNRRQELRKKIEHNILAEKDSIIQLEICEKCKDQIALIGNSTLPTKEKDNYRVLI